MNISIRNKPPPKYVGALFTGTLCFIVLCFMVLHRYCVFYNLNLWQLCINKSFGTIFQQHLLTGVSVSHFGNSYNISSFSIMMVFVMVIVFFDVTIAKRLQLAEGQLLVSIF